MIQSYCQRVDRLSQDLSYFSYKIFTLFIYNLPHSAKDFKTLNGDYLEGEKQKKLEGRRVERRGRREREAIFSCHVATLYLTPSHYPPKVQPLV